MAEFADRTLKCMDCGGDFIFTAGEQEFYSRKGFQQEPKRCRPCRETRKTRGGGERDSRGDRDREPRGGSDWRGGGESRSGGPVVESRPLPNTGDLRGSQRGAREMFEVTCAACGQIARVPFRPTPGRPVYCRDCYASGAGGAGGGRRE
jgi:CxxC-x17-CxxC domain-containing protein